MIPKIVFLILVSLILQVCVSTRDYRKQTDTCQYIRIGRLPQTSSLRYSIIKLWRPQNFGHKNALQSIRIDGFKSYNSHNIPYQFFKTFALDSKEAIKNFKISNDQEVNFKQLSFSFKSRTDCIRYQVPKDKTLVTLRFQIAKFNLMLGGWSTIVKLIDKNHLESQLVTIREKVQHLIIKNSLTAQDVASALNIFPEFLATNVGRAIYGSNGPSKLISEGINYEAIIVVIQEGQQFLAGPIINGQPDVIQVFHSPIKQQKCGQYQKITQTLETLEKVTQL